MGALANVGIIGLSTLEYLSVFYVFFGRRELSTPTFGGWMMVLASLLLAVSVALYPAPSETLYPLLLVIGYACALVAIKVVMRPTVASMLSMFAMSFAVLAVLEADVEFIIVKAGVAGLPSQTLLYLPVVICTIWASYPLVGRHADHSTFVLPSRASVCFTVMQMVTALLYVYSVRYLSTMPNDGSSVLGTILVTIGGFVFVLGSLLSIYYFNGKREAEHEKDIAKRYVEQQRRYFELLLAKEEETRRYRHDTLAQLVQLQYYREHGETEKMEVFVDQMLAAIRSIGQEDFDVGNEVVNAMLNYHLLPLRERGCAVTVRGMMPAEVRVPELDLCAIVSNLLQNASEAVRDAGSLSAQWVDVEVRSGTIYCTIRVRNSTEHHRLTRTTKVDREHHGYGLGNVTQTVGRYGGGFVYGLRGGTFSAEVSLLI